MGPVRGHVEAFGGRLDLAWPGIAGLTDLSLRCRLSSGSEARGGPWERTAVPGVYEARCGPVVTSLEVQVEGGQVCLRVSMTADRPVEVDELDLVGRLRIEATDTASVLYSGYQSWDEAGHLPAGDSGPGRESWWTVGVAGERGHGLAVAASSAAFACTRFLVQGPELLTTWCEAPGAQSSRTLCSLRRGETWTADPLLLRAGRDTRAALAELAGRVTPPEAAAVPRGWLTWYHFGPWVTRPDLIQNAKLLLEDEFDHVYRLIQIDDGWQEAYGDWIPNTKFPGGMRSLCDELLPLGFRVGVWAAPFLVSIASDVARDAPEDWFVHDATTGKRFVDPRHVFFGPMNILDGRHPGVQDHLRETFSRLYDEGIRYFKIDFLYAGGHAGLQGLRRGMEAIREGARDAYLLASGAPLLPVVGLVQGCRIGPDTATPWYDNENGTSRPTIFGDEVNAVGRNAAARSFMRPWFQLDADVALVGGNLSLEQGRQLVTMAALSGGPFFASDDLRGLPPERRQLLCNPEVLALVGGDPALPDWEPAADDRPPTRWRRGDVLAIFNWSQEDGELDTGVGAAVLARDLWERHDIAHLGSRLPVPANGVRLLRLGPGGS